MKANQSGNYRIARNSVFLSIRMVIVLLLTLYTTRLLLSALGVTDYGIYNVVCGFVGMFAFLNTSMSNGIQRFYNFELGKNGLEGANLVYCTSLVIQILLIVFIAVLVESIGVWYLNAKMVIPSDRIIAANYIFQFSIISFLFVIIQAPYTAAVIAHEKMDFFALVSVVDAVFKLLIAVFLSFFKKDLLIVYGILIMLISILDFFAYYLYCKRFFLEIHFNRKNVTCKMFRSMASFSGWNLFGSFSNMMRDHGVNLILNLFFGPVVNAARGVAMQINAGINGLVSNILTPVRPQVIQSFAQGNLSRAMRLTYAISKFSMWLLIVLSIPVCVEIDTILRLWLGEKVPEHTQNFVIIILLTTSVLIPMGALATLVHASGVMKKYQMNGSVVKFLSVPIGYFLLLKGYAPEWALIMVFVFDVIGFIYGLFIIRSIIRFDIREYVKSVFLPIFPIFAISMVTALLIHNFNMNGILRFFIISVTCGLLSFASFYTIALNNEERDLIRRFTIKMRNNC